MDEQARRIIMNLFPEADIQVENDGQFIIYTGVYDEEHQEDNSDD